jgi:hypothetical protein
VKLGYSKNAEIGGIDGDRDDNRKFERWNRTDHRTAKPKNSEMLV